MKELETWRRYASCWSAEPPERNEVLAGVVADDVGYRDPGQAVDGVAALGDYMDGFRHAFPGGRFAIDHVVAHHGHSLARWRQLDADGALVTHGASHAVHAGDGRLSQITGFFPLDPEPEGSSA